MKTILETLKKTFPLKEIKISTQDGHNGEYWIFVDGKRYSYAKYDELILPGFSDIEMKEMQASLNDATIAKIRNET